MTAASFRVVRIYFRLPPEPGGMEEHIARLSAEQRQQGIEVVNVFNVGEADGPALRLYGSRDLLGIRPATLRNIMFYGGALMRSGQLRSSLPTILHVHGDWSDFLLGRMLGRAIGAAGYVASIHAALSASRRLYSLVLKDYGAIFATGKAEQSALQAVLGRDVQHLPSAPHDSFLAEQGLTGIRYDVITVANLFDVKMPGLVLDCAAQRPDLRFGLLGDGPLAAPLRERIARERLTNVDMPGRLPRSGVIAALRHSRLFLSTSSKEGTPTAALEAMAVGLPVLLTPSNDYRWLVEDGVNGRITSSWDIGEIIAGIDDLLRDERRRQAMGANNRLRASGHSWTRKAQRVSDVMTALVSAKAQ